MNYQTLLAASVFAIVSLITPGPNNTMVLASGLHFGIRRTLPHLSGICLGFSFMLVLVGLGLHTLFVNDPVLLELMRYAGACYMAWLAWKLASSRSAPGNATPSARPLGFWGAAAFQWINPKGWVMAMTAVAGYLPLDAGLSQVLTLGALFAVLGVPCVGAWVAFGSSMRTYLQNPLHLRLFNNAMALALLASLIPLLMP
jgi:threonine/homoserine/homoserine lactone efflux protein